MRETIHLVNDKITNICSFIAFISIDDFQILDMS